MLDSVEVSANASLASWLGRLRCLRSPGLRHSISNIAVAILFLFTLAPANQDTFSASGRVWSSPAELIWVTGAILMALLSLIRVPPTAAMVDLRAVIASTGMMVVPAAMRPGAQATGWLAQLAIIVEFAGMAMSQVSRLYLGRRFGLLPANRGIVVSGPFRIVRHPIYAGWLILTMGFLMAYPSWFNIAILLITLPFMIWRISLEEQLLQADAAYCVYCVSTRYRLIPGII